jgi:hypothetical protein
VQCERLTGTGYYIPAGLAENAKHREGRKKKEAHRDFSGAPPSLCSAVTHRGRKHHKLLLMGRVIASGPTSQSTPPTIASTFFFTCLRRPLTKGPRPSRPPRQTGSALRPRRRLSSSPGMIGHSACRVHRYDSSALPRLGGARGGATYIRGQALPCAIPTPTPSG